MMALRAEPSKPARPAATAGRTNSGQRTGPEVGVDGQAGAADGQQQLDDDQQAPAVDGVDDRSAEQRARQERETAAPG